MLMLQGHCKPPIDLRYQCIITGIFLNYIWTANIKRIQSILGTKNFVARQEGLKRKSPVCGYFTCIVRRWYMYVYKGISIHSGITIMALLCFFVTNAVQSPQSFCISRRFLRAKIRCMWNAEEAVSDLTNGERHASAQFKSWNIDF
jgi:hypothetical protein